MTAKTSTRIFKDDDFQTVGIAMELRNDEGFTTKSLHAGIISHPGLYVKETNQDYTAEFCEMCELIAEKQVLKQFEGKFFDIALKALGQEKLDGVGFDFSEIRKALEKNNARFDEIINSIR